MFKRYKLRPKVIRPLSVRSRSIGVAKRISDELVKILAMLKHSSATVRLRGAREAEKLATISEDMIKEIMKMAIHDKKEVRSHFYRVANSLLSKALTTEQKVWEEYLFLYLSVVTKCTVVDVRKDGLQLLDMVVKYFPEKTNQTKDELIKWLVNDEKILGLDPKEVGWHKEIKKRIEGLRNLKKTQAISTPYSSTIYLGYTHLAVNGQVVRYFAMK
ncbi:hypothetical protein NEHOM01_1072 [Nematocida homosporus]|uniref:uncharacterized protein n=1 Tax=Nematocida homosporus TaxID=1912981 RepID=UPI00221FCE2A|nr:uncharacterized protein NEHOM01_1072 [Nematocida homosporus]KAI5185795.1 hypothetical protein NEHOM01_1072 [Nematocida homosporus]